jgi:hypothetical protein
MLFVLTLVVEWNDPCPGLENLRAEVPIGAAFIGAGVPTASRRQRMADWTESLMETAV